MFHVMETNTDAPDVITDMDFLKNIKLTIDVGKLIIEPKVAVVIGHFDPSAYFGCFLAAYIRLCCR